MTYQSRGRQKKKFTITASEEGVEIAEKALMRLGFESKNNFAKSQFLSRTSVTKFFNHQPIQLDTFKRICDALKLNWREIAGLEEEQQQKQVKRKDCSSLEVQEEVGSVQILQRLVTVIDQKNGTAKAEIILKGDINSVDNLKTLELILRQYSGDTIKIKDIQEGSIKLKIEGSEEDINRLLERIKSGELTEVNSFPIKDINILSESSDDEESNESVDKWRLVQEIVSQPVRNRDLSGVDLSDADLRGAFLSNANLRGADLRGTDLTRRSFLRGADLREAILSDADLSRADLREAILSDADLSRADLSRADLNGADLREAILREADLRGAFLNRANLRGADLREAILRGAIFSGSDLNRANLRGADLREAILRRANLRRADLSKSQVTNTTFSSNSLGMTEELKQNLIKRGARVEDFLKDPTGKTLIPH